MTVGRREPNRFSYVLGLMVKRYLTTARRLISSRLNPRAIERFYCDVDAESLERYREGGYHPTQLGDTFKDGRYKILQKLGFGGYATVWLAEDLL